MIATNPALRTRMPSADWFAFGVALVCSALGSLMPRLGVLVPIAVFLPSLLRELGVLRDADEFTRRVMYRAGFHALLITVLLVFATWGTARPGGGPLSFDLLTGETLRKIIMYTFVVSYLLQYWGGRDGSFRIMLGLAVWSLTPIVAIVARPEKYPGEALGAVLVLPLVLVGLAVLTRRWPRVAGALLLVIFCAAIALSIGILDSSDARAAVPALLLQACIFPGAVGVALLTSARTTAVE